MRRFLPIILILIIGIFFRFYLLGSVPAGITSDEADNGYDAYSILLTGKDQWNSPYPLVSFRGFGDYRSPLYTYLLVPSIRLFSLTPLAVRIPSAIAGVLSILFIYFLTRKLFGEKIGIVSAFLMAVSPWAIGLSRQGIESNVAILLMLAGLYCFLIAKKFALLMYVSIALFLLSAYTYTSYVLFAPLTVICLVVIYGKDVLRSKKHLIICGLIFVFGLLPIIFKSSAGNVRFSPH